MKKCVTCEVKKPETDFSLNRGHRRRKCKACVAENSRLWRLEHPGYAATYMRGYIKTNYAQMLARMKVKKLEIHAWKRDRGCTVCGETEPWVLDMHHLDPTTKEANSATSATLPTFLKEADKCILLCSNCHRKVHAGVLRITKTHVNKFKRSIK